MARRRKATKTPVAVETETEQVAAIAKDAAEPMIETKKAKKTTAKVDAKQDSDVAKDDDTGISPKKAKQRSKREIPKKDAKSIEQSVEETVEPVKKKSRAKKDPAQSEETNGTSENDKHAANNTTSTDENTKKRTKRNAVKNDVPTVDEEMVEEKPKKAKIPKLKKEEHEQSAEVQAPKKKPRSKAEQSKVTESATAEEAPKTKGRKRTAADKPDEAMVDTKKSTRVTKKTVEVSPKKKSMRSRKAATNNDEKATAEVKSSSVKRTKVMEKSPPMKKVVAKSRKPNVSKKVSSDQNNEPTPNDNVATVAENGSSDEEEPPMEVPIVKSRKRTASQEGSVTKIATPIDDSVTKRNKNERTVTKDTTKPKQKMNSTATDYAKINFESDKEHTLKICSWNVAGLRALVGKHGFEYFEHEKPDIICLQEIKCLEDEVPAEVKLPGYHMYCCAKPGGRAGIALLSKKMPYNIENNIGDDEMDEEGRIITAEYSKFYLVCVYVPNAGRKLINLDRRLRWNKMFEQHVNKLNAIKPVVILGDMNVAHNEIDLANPKTNTKSAGFSKEERNGMTDLLDHGFVDTFRHLYPDREKAYTFWSYMGSARTKNIGWRLDYAIVSESLVTKVVDNIIRSEILGSDHCPIILLLNL